MLATAVPANAASVHGVRLLAERQQPTIYDFINSATTSLDMTMYELEDTTAVNDLIALKNKGVTVRVVLDRQHKSANNAAYTALTGAGVGVVWSSSAFVYTHQKTITVDGVKSLILTGNLTSQYYPPAATTASSTTTAATSPPSRRSSPPTTPPPRSPRPTATTCSGRPPTPATAC